MGAGGASLCPDFGDKHTQWFTQHGSGEAQTWLTPQDLVQEMGDLLETPGDLKTLPFSEQHFVVTNLLFGLENVLRGVSKALPKGSFIPPLS